MRPNVLLISLDTLRFDCVKAAHKRRFPGEFADQVSSPNIDRLAEHGILFTQAISNSPYPALVAELLAQVTQRFHLERQAAMLNEEETAALEEQLRGLGYLT